LRPWIASEDPLVVPATLFFLLAVLSWGLKSSLEMKTPEGAIIFDHPCQGLEPLMWKVQEEEEEGKKASIPDLFRNLSSG
jgi:hypothetical protein